MHDDIFDLCNLAIRIVEGLFSILQDAGFGFVGSSNIGLDSLVRIAKECDNYEDKIERLRSFLYEKVYGEEVLAVLDSD